MDPSSVDFASSDSSMAEPAFCERCFSLLELPNAAGFACCRFCDYRLKCTESMIRTSSLMSTKESTSLSFGDTKSYKQSLMEQMKPKTRKMIEEECPKCKAPQMSYHEVQTRSADEGVTIFYECLVCSHKSVLNS